MGKTAVASEFCRFYSFPGDRLFSAGCCFLRLSGLEPDVAAHQLLESLWRMRSIQLVPEATACKRLIVLDDVDGAMWPAAFSGGSLEWRQALNEALGTPLNVCLIFTSRQPCSEALLTCNKVMPVQIQPLKPGASAELFLCRSGRRLVPKDFDGCGMFEDSWPRSRIVQQFASHPLIKAVGGRPSHILRAAALVTPQLPSLLEHPRLRLEGATPHVPMEQTASCPSSWSPRG